MRLLLQVFIIAYFSVSVIFSDIHVEFDHEIERSDEPENVTCHLVKTFNYEDSGFPPRK